MHFVDLHTHLLPAVDDGAATLEETLEMLRIAHAGGTRRMVATPHMFHPRFAAGAAEVKAGFARTRARIERARGGEEYGFLREMTVELGAENYVSAAFLEALAAGSVLTLSGGRHLLIEFSPLLAPFAMEAALERVLASGLVPVLAHVERYLPFQRRPGKMRRFADMGCLYQVNAESLVGLQGRRLRKICLTLLKHGLVHVVASDAHGAGSRGPDLRQAHDFLARKYPPETTSALLWENPSLILRQEDSVP